MFLSNFYKIRFQCSCVYAAKFPGIWGSEAVDLGRIELPFFPCEGNVMPLYDKPEEDYFFSSISFKTASRAKKATENIPVVKVSLEIGELSVRMVWGNQTLSSIIPVKKAPKITVSIAIVLLKEFVSIV